MPVSSETLRVFTGLTLATLFVSRAAGQPLHPVRPDRRISGSSAARCWCHYAVTRRSLSRVVYLSPVTDRPRSQAAAYATSLHSVQLPNAEHHGLWLVSRDCRCERGCGFCTRRGRPSLVGSTSTADAPLLALILERSKTPRSQPPDTHITREYTSATWQPGRSVA